MSDTSRLAGSSMVAALTACVIVIGLILSACSGGTEDIPPVPTTTVGQEASPTATPTLEPSSIPTPVSTPTVLTLTPTAVPPPLGSQPYRMVIESIGVDAPVQTLGLDENALPQVPTGDNAREVVAWYDFSAQPGTGSNAVFVGHGNYFGSAVFRDIELLAPGDIIALSGDDGVRLIYTTTEVLFLDPGDPDSLKVMQATDQDMITVITEAGEWVEEFPGQGYYSDARVIRAELTSVER